MVFAGLTLFVMAKDYAKAFYDSEEWHTCRDAYKVRTDLHGGFCERCRKKGKFEVGEIVHHKIWLTRTNISDPSVSLNFKNLELICRGCHNVEHTAKKRRYAFDARGDLIPPVADRRSKN